mmetsp:Transcript_123878/g.361763  ORF Transcript_123878/g.361763 Transcript_123878/m.361763 type:complete len:209 (+) Transcript_123878:28-654(+)
MVRRLLLPCFCATLMGIQSLVRHPWVVLTVGISALFDGAGATIRMPEEFNVEKDFSEKEKWKKAQAHIRCDLCKLTVGHTLSAVGENFNEDDVYDHIEKICDVEELYDKHEIRQPTTQEPGTTAWQLVPVSEATDRTAHTARWQSHAMKELCDNVIRPFDDEIKDSFVKAARKRKKKTGDQESHADVVRGTCENIRLCSSQKKGGTEL